MSLPSTMSHAFSNVPPPQIQRSSFDRSRGYKTSITTGKLYPVLLDEIIPGDTVSLQSTLFGRISTLIFPIMDNVFLDTFHFFVPSRILWDNWERFNGAQDDPGDSVDFEIPTMSGAPYIVTQGSLGDYFGLPTQVDFAAGERISALPFRAYNRIWNDWFRDQNLQDMEVNNTDDGPDTFAEYELLSRGKRHDYFTSCLPWPQKGDAVTLPLGTTAPVIGNGQTVSFTNGTAEFGFGGIAGGTQTRWNTVSDGTAVGTAFVDANSVSQSLTAGLSTDPLKSGMIADLSSALAATVNQLREAFAFQKILERDARGGTRYVELIKSQFAVTIPDFRLQRPEYLGGSSQRINVQSVAQNSETATTPQGNLSAYTQVTSQSGYNKSFVEHGYILTLVNVRSDITYQQGLHKLWSRSTRFDFYLPALAHLGEQPVLNKEIFYADTGTGAETVFGYQERWGEMRYGISQVTGLMRSNAAGSLDTWHLATEFSPAPALNATFIVDNPPLGRVVAVPEADGTATIVLDVYHKMKHARPMPTYSVPGQLDRF